MGRFAEEEEEEGTPLLGSRSRRAQPRSWSNIAWGAATVFGVVFMTLTLAHQNSSFAVREAINLAKKGVSKPVTISNTQVSSMEAPFKPLRSSRTSLKPHIVLIYADDLG